jgi:selenocysteine-specific elongation factor
VVCDPELDRVTDRCDAWVELRPAAKRPLDRHAAVRLYVGTAEAMARLTWLDGRAAVAPKESAFAQIVLREPIAAFGGDRFVLRDATGRATIGGGVILDPFAPPARRSSAARLVHLTAVRDAATPLDRLRARDADRDRGRAGSARGRRQPAGRRGAHPPRRRNRPPSASDAAHAEAYVTGERWQALRTTIADALTAYHQAPRERGMDMESLRSQLGELARRSSARSSKDWRARRSPCARRACCLPAHSGGLSPAEQALAEVLVARLPPVA